MLRRRALALACVLLIFACLAFNAYYGEGREHRLPKSFFETHIEGRSDPSLENFFFTNLK